MKTEYAAGTRFRVTLVGKIGKRPGTFVNEMDRLITDVLPGSISIVLGLFLNGGDAVAFLFALGFDHPYRLRIDEEGIIYRPHFRLIFADSYARTI